MPLGLCRALEALAEAMRPAAGACAGAPAAACGSDDCSTAAGESSDAFSDDEQMLVSASSDKNLKVRSVE